MAVNYSDQSPGTAVVWMNTGGDKALNLKNLTNGSIREGDKSATLVDGTKGFPERLTVLVEAKFGSALADGVECPIYLGWSGSATAGTDNPGGLTGADAAVGDSDQLPLLSFIGSLIGSSSLGTGIHRIVLDVVPKREYLIPVFQNSSGQSTTNVNSETKITVQPWYRRTPIA